MNAASDTTRPPTRRRPGELTWDRASQLMLEGALILLMVLIVASTVAGVVSAVTDRQVVVPVNLEVQTTEAATRATVETASGTLTLTDATAAQIVLHAAPSVLGAVAGLCATFCLLQVVRSLRQGVPFHRANVRRLTVAAVMTLGGGLLVALIGTFSTMTLAMDGQDLLGDSTAVIAGGELPLWPIGLGLLLMCLAEFFRRGTAMTEDLDGLV